MLLNVGIDVECDSFSRCYVWLSVVTNIIKKVFYRIDYIWYMHRRHNQIMKKRAPNTAEHNVTGKGWIQFIQ